MKKGLSSFGKQENVYQQLASANRKAIDEYNKQTLSTLLLLGWVLILLPLISVPFSNTKARAINAYILTFIAFFTLFLLFKIPAIKKHTLVGMYAAFSILFLLGIYLSVIHSPNMRATILLGGFVIMPLSLIEHPYKIKLFLVFWLLIHTALAFYLKPEYVLDDAINCLCAAVLGCYLGETLVLVRLENFEAKRLLVIEKETDVLTSVYNRRKLFETVACLETENYEKPSGAFFLDIDNFKTFNDSYGHAAGDKCLNCFGEILTKFSQNFRLHFYRYGGEEFFAFAYGYSEKELLSIAESLRIAVQSTDVAGRHITVSIGVAYCGREQIKNYEDLIGRADEAAYVAKHEGRNRVHLYQNKIQPE
ncbi:GGDEF domain-containing protein [Scatolibacter rhodanostii]|uniref:GGDEF domain-containing protein n=1 Tax=Scatolibacter rhodanostii TaxID=2014781 RepID=UPI000C06C5F8|nr:GGDEF domain-containing protein [Scatolibacter rhodanostii]